MSDRRDRTNQYGYFCPTENAAVSWLDRPKEPVRKASPRKDYLTEADLNRLDANRARAKEKAVAEAKKAEAEERLHKARLIQVIISSLLSFLDVQVDVLRVKMPGGYYYRYDKADPRYSKSLQEEEP